MRVEKNYPWSDTEHRFNIFSQNEDEIEILLAIGKLISKQPKESNVSGYFVDFSHLQPGFVTLFLLTRPRA